MAKSFLVMGVSGCGKSTIAKSLAQSLQVPFIEADAYHPPANVAKMKSGQALNDDDRLPWLTNLAQELKKNEKKGSVLACSALKEKYRNILNSLLIEDLQIIFLNGGFDLIKKRMDNRSNHFMPAKLLQSQFDTLEIPTEAWQFDIEQTPQAIHSSIIAKINMNSDFKKKATLGLIGLGVMGKSLARNFASRDLTVAVYNAPLPGEEKVVQDFVTQYSTQDFIATESLEDLVNQVASPRIILLMVKSGEPVDQLMEQLSPHLDSKDIVIDAGNSYFKDSIRRTKMAKDWGFEFVGMGVSGGEEGALKGPAIMPAGSAYAKGKLLPLLQQIAAIADDKPCVQWLGTDGSGHFVKMVHNGIEYADMQILTEVYAIAKRNLGFNNQQIADQLGAWKKSMHNSYLLDITVDILQHKEGSNYLLEEILDVAGHKGTGLWTVKEALNLGVPIPSIAAAMNERILSSKKDLREEVAISENDILSDSAKQVVVEHLEDAILFGRLIALAEGFYLIRSACQEYNWEIDLAKVAQLWRGGCIIRSDMLSLLINVLDGNEKLDHLFQIPAFAEFIHEKYKSAALVLAELMTSNVAIPALSAAMNYYKSMRTAYLPINLIQAQRDYFGAHTYRRLDDRTTARHSKWMGNNE